MNAIFKKTYTKNINIFEEKIDQFMEIYSNSTIYVEHNQNTKEDGLQNIKVTYIL